jgi:hypothetical protein
MILIANNARAVAERYPNRALWDEDLRFCCDIRD